MPMDAPAPPQKIDARLPRLGLGLGLARRRDLSRVSPHSHSLAYCRRRGALLGATTRGGLADSSETPMRARRYIRMSCGRDNFSAHLVALAWVGSSPTIRQATFPVVLTVLSTLQERQV